jgi:hypothetical protein
VQEKNDLMLFLCGSTIRIVVSQKYILAENGGYRYGADIANNGCR